MPAHNQEWAPERKPHPLTDSTEREQTLESVTDPDAAVEAHHGRRGRFAWLVLTGLLFGLAILSYGLVLPKLGVYWDDWAYIWTRLELGFSGLLRHFSFSRPVAGQLHNLAIVATNGNPLVMQLYAQLMHVLCTLAVVALVRCVWRRSEMWLSGIVGLLFLLYPGFTMLPIAINFGFSYLLIGLLCLSWILSIRALRGEGAVRVQIGIALALSALNLFASEYFFMLELVRPVLFWIVIGRDETLSLRDRFMATVRASLPYLFVFFAGVLFRVFFNQTQTLHYEFSLLDRLKADPLSTILMYLWNMASDIRKVLIDGWGIAFRFGDATVIGARTLLIRYVVTGVAAILTAVAFIVWMHLDRTVGTSHIPDNDDASMDRNAAMTARRARVDALGKIIVGFFLLIVGGQPFWLTESYLSFEFANSRYTLPFLPGMALFWGGVTSFLITPVRGRVRRIVVMVLTVALSLAIGFATGFHFLNATEYRRDWTLTRDFFQQLTWRVPGLKPGTTVITNQLPIRFSTDNSLTAPLNWIYAEPGDTDDERMPFMLYTNSKRAKTLSDFADGQTITQEYLSARFIGNTSDTISVYYRAPGCVRVLDPEVDVLNQTIPILDRTAATLTNAERIRVGVPLRSALPDIFGPEPTRDSWCRYFEAGDLARQQGDWQKVVELGDTAFALGDYPNDPAERFPFLEGYAMTGRWDDALRLTNETLAITPVMNNPLCALWARIERDAPVSDEKATALEAINDLLVCDF